MSNINFNRIYDCIIIGGGPAGLTASVYMKRAGYKSIVVGNGDLGGNLNKINLIENYLGFPDGISGIELSELMINQCEKAGVEFDYFNKVVEIQKASDSHYNQVFLSDGSVIYSNTVITCCGSIPNVLNLSCEKELLNKKIHLCATCDGPLYKNKGVFVIGGGNSAVDFCCTLSKYCSRVVMFLRRDEFRADKTMVDKLKYINNKEILYNVNITDIFYISEHDNLIIKYKQQNDIDGNMSAIGGGVFYALGYKQNHIPMCIGGMLSGHFEAGDCADNKYRQISVACGDGCKAALNAIAFLQQNQNIKYTYDECDYLSIPDYIKYK